MFICVFVYVVCVTVVYHACIRVIWLWVCSVCICMSWCNVCPVFMCVTSVCLVMCTCVCYVYMCMCNACNVCAILYVCFVCTCIYLMCLCVCECVHERNYWELKGDQEMTVLIWVLGGCSFGPGGRNLCLVRTDFMDKNYVVDRRKDSKTFLLICPSPPLYYIPTDLLVCHFRTKKSWPCWVISLF